MAVSNVLRRYRRSIGIFCGTLLLAGGASLFYVYSRAPLYRAVAYVRITGAAPNGAGGLIDQARALASPAVLQRALGQLAANGPIPATGSNPAAFAQPIDAIPDAETNSFELIATGPDPAFAAALANAVGEAYRGVIEETSARDAAKLNTLIKAEATALDRQIEAKRKAIDDFRSANDIGALERQQTNLTAQIAQLTQNNADGQKKLDAAEARLESLKDAAAQGHPVTRSEDDASLTDLANRATALRNQLADVAQRFTPAYIALDAKLRLIPGQVADIENELSAKRAESAKSVMSQAVTDVSKARAELSRSGAALDDAKREAQDISGQLDELGALEADLEQLKSMRTLAQGRAKAFEASRRGRSVRVDIVKRAVPNPAPWRPLYTRDAGIGLAGSLLLAAFSTCAGAFVRRRRGDTLVYRSVASPVLAPYSGPPLLLPPPDSRPEPAVLGPPHPNARELRGDEIAALMAKGSDEVRLILAALLTGMTPAEIISLRWDAADPKASSVTMDGDPDRRVRIEDSLLARLRVRWLANGARGAAVIRDEDENPASEADIDRLLVFTAHDAGITRPQDITAEVLSHTYAAFRMRQARRAA